MSEMNSGTKIFAKDFVLNNFPLPLRGQAGLQHAADLFLEHSSKIKLHEDTNYLLYVSQICIALALLMLLLPLMIIIFAAIKLTSRGPGIYSQKRVGKNGHEFLIYKFRTMVLNAEESSGAILSWQGDPRITALGKFLRATHLDELPQLINVLKGEMSFIGPRPERKEIIKTFVGQVKGYNKRSVVLPGITGLAQICCPYDATPELKLKYDLYYIYNRSSLILNLMILFYTIGKFYYGIVGDTSRQQT
ncbi:MAG: hypothetical protein A2X86_13870 [Bdellovibrionales bacterium GWA2_49_15]|nr:MAG: hypothetical protein A2X86_13870 [Bdellovibrionales bacterium GWA2_49_15]HAZ13615.1 UDP-phosphate N-acetylgalactosaminyl-1-phosphate transferase [Bdellovibrionales bacterium]